MSRLDSVIRRLQAQRTCIDWAVEAVSGRDGCVLELGLGNGRTYDHLRERMPGRAIYVFERQVKAHPACIPPDDRLFLGDIADTLPAAARQLGRSAILVHSDLGTGDEARNRALAAQVAALLAPMLLPGAIVMCDQPMPPQAGWQRQPEPDGVPADRYFLFRVAP